jgi:succinate dehydrogenase / fumarate reductase, cytochrome b subunit
MNLLPRPVQSSLGSKYLMAITGLGLVGFVIIHMIGNLLIYAGRDALNSYAQFLKSNGELLWLARGGLFLFFVVHIAVALRLSWKNSVARPTRYVYEDTVEASWASRHMLMTGLVLLAFTIYHLAHFTLGIVPLTGPKGVIINYQEFLQSSPNEPTRQDVYAMVVFSFKNPMITVTYLIAMVFLWLHLWHGVYSMFQSLGITNPRFHKLIRGLGPVVSTIVLIGNCSIPLSVYLGLIGMATS